VLDYKNEFETHGDVLNGSAGLARAQSFEEWLNSMSVNTTSAGLVAASQYLAVRTRDKKVVGMINIRHTLNDYLMQFGGHIGYSVRKSERRKGYAKEMLRLALEKCRELGLEKVLVTCDKDNIASAKTILANGGVFVNEVVNTGRLTQRYWIDCPLKSGINGGISANQDNKRNEIYRMLQALSDEKYAAFSGKLLPGCKNILGVRLPLLHKAAKQICDDDWRENLAHGLKGGTFEETMLRGFVIAASECGWREKKRLMQSFVAEIDNWSVCDSFCASFKIAITKRRELLPVLKRYILSDLEFDVRFAAVMLMTYYLDEEYIDTALCLLSLARHQGYYAATGVAWALSAAFFARPAQVACLLRSNEFDARMVAKTKEKIRQSKRFKPAEHASLIC